METLKPLISELIELIKGTQGFVLSQAPDFVRQFVISGIVENLGWVVWGTTLALATFYLGKWLHRKWDDVEDVCCVFGTIALICLGFVSGGLIVSSTDELLKIWLAPKVYIVTNMVKFLK